MGADPSRRTPPVSASPWHQARKGRQQKQQQEAAVGQLVVCRGFCCAAGSGAGSGFGEPNLMPVKRCV
jgi:hypothetical protein